jgi:glycosyltransferase involved in cell wall biosynthesis
MRVCLVAPSPVPYAPGGAERLFDGLVGHINDHTPHDAELVKLPSREHDLPGLVATYREFSRLDLSHFDLVISTKYPAWMVRHPNHVLYLQHKLRGLYDTYHFTGLPERVDFEEMDLRHLQETMRHPPAVADPLEPFFEAFERVVDTRSVADPALSFPGPLAREIVHFLDAVGMAPDRIARYYAISRTVAEDRGYFPAGVVPGALHHPSNLTGFHCDGYDYLFTASRLDGPKRVGLLVEAMGHVDADVGLKIAGTGPETDRLQEMASDDPRIDFLGYVGTDELVDLYAGALAVPFVPFDEDLGLITLEAFMSSKPVITCNDSGGTNELVENGISGFVVPPDPGAIGMAIETLATDPDLARRMGESGRRRAATVTWDQVAATLLAGDRPAASADLPARRSGRQKVVMLANSRIFPPTQGGQIRGAWLCRGLAERFDIEIVSLVEHGAAAASTVMSPGVTQTIVPKSQDHEYLESELSRSVDWVPVTDIAAWSLHPRSPALGKAIQRATEDAIGVVLEQPYLIGVLRAVDLTIPVVYDAHDLEVAQKRNSLPDAAPGAAALLADVVAAEQAALDGSVLVTTPSERDAAFLAEAGTPVAVVPNGVDLDAITFTAPQRRRALAAEWVRRFRGDGSMRGPVVFFASWHPPNLEAAETILATALELPDVAFVMAGSHTQYYERWTVPANVVLMGFVADSTKSGLLAAAAIGVNPMMSGSGTNLKALELFAAGVPVVSTEFGMRGIGAQPGVHYVPCTATDLAGRIERALRHPEATDAMVRSARELVEGRYGWDEIGGRFARITAAAFDPDALGAVDAFRFTAATQRPSTRSR